MAVKSLFKGARKNSDSKIYASSAAGIRWSLSISQQIYHIGLLGTSTHEIQKYVLSKNMLSLGHGKRGQS